ncbi:MAG: alpha/beta hydrolase [Acidobacteriota bacterium]|nr:alpha/beta hydrolase [Acidobacteriota bacterium]
MNRQSEHRAEVSGAAGFPEECQLAITITAPDRPDPDGSPIVCFAFPGGGYGRHYYTFDMPDGEGGGQAGWHASRGWIFVAIDHPGVGDSSQPDPNSLTFENVAAADATAVRFVLDGLGEGSLVEGYPPLRRPIALGMGQSMGGCFLVVTQAQHTPFAGIAVLGYSGIHTVVPSRPGVPNVPMPWIPRSSTMAAPIVLNSQDLVGAGVVAGADDLAEAARSAEHPWQWAFHYDDEPADIVQADMAANAGIGPTPVWHSPTIPPCAAQMVSPGAVASEAASIRVPVFVGVGERDVVPDPHAEPRAFFSSPDITLVITERMAHMHNFAHTREKLWSRLHLWGEGIAAATHSSDDSVK